MLQLFNLILFQPLFNLLIFLYNFIPGHDLGLAIIILTVIIKLILYPLAQQSLKSQKALQELQPKLDSLKKQFGHDKEKLAKEMMVLYKQEKVNPLSSCLPLLIQLPFLIAVYRVFASGLDPENLKWLYPFVTSPQTINAISFGFLDLAKPNLVLAVLTGLAQFWQSKMLIVGRPPKGMSGAKDEQMMAMMNKQMLYFMPVFTVLISVRLPSGLVLYWLVMTLLTIFQQHFIFKKLKPVSPLSSAN
ncbi:MAG: hypothetical protein A2729_01745 [Candidatus Buchananbacteria bacterium RIFCSPHIGHO2_01_FULL_39_14]|uniref:Membrane insertase YidC/Oxa/ALB C-terminal domain-containing protein n=2 Tax=Candidatus Buchananiibacteriota TaxID=1817903 RepID=A0A1G1YR59_9BACT|nr:MAG: hypothetical protein A2729_01745 [Candidatus Buchananbacteria bacterium RIFCSPHIGHO2_01_FULL_39_14]OGY48824.1 MAG: hypothetical protein A3D39_03415 [Candidatus Buchananbacteria bacterium RIFCSPHIGHO2_02_FULL_39_17]OGY54110.1 MAG: hypothetical protein A2912_01940 [Candidatus Buchananbacteria bacterium RIFCSPLOWO2_01_FULL_40_23b]